MNAIQEKAKRYDNVVGKLKQFMAQGVDPLIRRADVQDFFPELAESEDERIRKELLEHCKNQAEPYILTGNECLQIQSWIDWLEKQGEQETLCDKCKKVQPSHSCQDITALGRCVMEHGQKTAEFHEGDWLCENEPNNYARFIQILETVNVMGKERYRISRDIHNDKDLVEFYFLEKYYHKFGINDAKDGDVLHCWIDGDEFVLIYKGIKDGYITTYGHLYQKLKLFAEEPTTMFCRTIQGHFTPATKEQRDLLFQKMKEAGYTFDFEKKELKKIINESQIKKNLQDNSFRRMFEQKPAECKQEIKLNGGIVYEDFNEGDGYYKVNLAYLSKSQVEFIENLVASWQNPTNNTTVWSEGDEKMLDFAIRAIGLCKQYAINHQINGYSKLPDVLNRYEELQTWLKSLGPKKQWKPSDKQMNALAYAVFDTQSYSYHKNLSSLEQQLKKLKE